MDVGPLEPRSCPGDEEVLLGVHGVLLAASEHDIRPDGLRLFPADRCPLKPPGGLALRIVPVRRISESDVHVGGPGVATILDDRKVAEGVQMLVIRASSC